VRHLSTLKKGKSTGHEMENKKGSFITNRSAEKSYHIPAFTTNRKVTSIFEIMPATIKKDSYKIIMGRNIIANLGFIIDFKNGRLLWDELELNLNGNASETVELYAHSSSAVTAVEELMVKILDAGYKKSDLEDSIPSHLDPLQGSILHSLLLKYEAIFEGTLGTMPGAPYIIPICQDANI
jgi:hypothetical protein